MSGFLLFIVIIMHAFELKKCKAFAFSLWDLRMYLNFNTFKLLIMRGYNNLYLTHSLHTI
jgi:hypothetical protein